MSGAGIEESGALLGGRGYRQGAPSWFENLDWAKFEEAAKPFTKIYDPPQFYSLPYTNCFFPTAIPCCGHRSTVCDQPAVAHPCCCASIVRHCIPGLETVKISEPDEWFKRILRLKNPHTPEHLLGYYWMEDNNAPEVLMGFQQIDWLPDQSMGWLNPKYNWTNDATCFGACCATLNCTANHMTAWPFTISPNKKWLNIASNWIYIFQPGDELHTPDGTKIEIHPGDMMRLSFFDATDPATKPAYQYLVRRVAYLNEDGELVKTKAYDELKRRATMEDFPITCRCCCGCCECLPPCSHEGTVKYFERLNNHQTVSIPPSMQKMWPDVAFD